MKPDVRDRSPRRLPGASIQNAGKYLRPCKTCGRELLMARVNGPHRFGWWAFDSTPIDERGIRYYTVHDCAPSAIPTQAGMF